MATETSPPNELRQAAASLAAPEIDKIVIAIHGIGDQFRNATVQSVVNIFSRCFDQAAGVPLGEFYSADGKIRTFRLTAPPEVEPSLRCIGFVEAYWADIPRRVQRRGYTIEETKAWARTVVARVRSRYQPELKAQLNLQPEDYDSAAAVIQEMIDAIAVLQNLLFLAEKAGILKFNLANLLTTYVGDVQVVADFANYRERISRHVWDILEAVHIENPKADIYIVAHSEGTVVTLFTLLKAFCAGTESPPPPPRPAWADKVRGLMTIGSPIDKHIILWTKMWDDVQTPDRSDVPLQPIAWRNYYDYGDPVGFKLDTAQKWLDDHNWHGFFEKHDHGFARYFLPGKAHNDYWDDPLVFGHFINDVLKLPAKANGNRVTKAPPDRRWAQFSSYVTPYVLITIISLAAVYLVHSAVNSFVKETESWLLALRHVAGFTCLLLGTTVASRIPCLTRKPRLKLVAALLFFVLVFAFVLLFAGWPPPIGTGNALAIGLAIALSIFAICFSIWADRHTRFLQCWPPLRVLGRGMRPLLIAGGLAAATLIVYRVCRSHGGNLWPLILSSAAFMYLWWLAAILFDLSFTWQRYVRLAVWQEYLATAREPRLLRERKLRAG